MPPRTTRVTARTLTGDYVSLVATKRETSSEVLSKIEIAILFPLTNDDVRKSAYAEILEGINHLTLGLPLSSGFTSVDTIDPVSTKWLDIPFSFDV